MAEERIEVERPQTGAEDAPAGDSGRIEPDPPAPPEPAEERLRGAAEHRIDLEIERLRGEIKNLKSTQTELEKRLSAIERAVRERK